MIAFDWYYFVQIAMKLAAYGLLFLNLSLHVMMDVTP